MASKRGAAHAPASTARAASFSHVVVEVEAVAHGVDADRREPVLGEQFPA
jgi:hypothetical protein